jgi:hypothetical protein
MRLLFFDPSQSSKRLIAKWRLIVARIGIVFVRPLILVVAAATLIAMSGTGALSQENNCRRLEDLARQYAGVRLTSEQQQLKRKLVAWYNDNCKRTHSVQARR